MNLIPVKSSNIKAVGYEDNSLIIEFIHGRVYKYHSVSREVYDEFLASKSLGSYFHRFISKTYRGEILN